MSFHPNGSLGKHRFCWISKWKIIIIIIICLSWTFVIWNAKEKGKKTSKKKKKSWLRNLQDCLRCSREWSILRFCSDRSEMKSLGGLWVNKFFPRDRRRFQKQNGKGFVLLAANYLTFQTQNYCYDTQIIYLFSYNFLHLIQIENKNVQTLWGKKWGDSLFLLLYKIMFNVLI